MSSDKGYQNHFFFVFLRIQLEKVKKLEKVFLGRCQKSRLKSFKGTMNEISRSLNIVKMNRS